LHEASLLLRSDLEWSDDFDGVKDSLAALLEAIQTNLSARQIEKLEPALSSFVADLLDDGQSLIIPNPLGR
jgi:hypothetical protein